jgi:hypothetical protein
MKSMETCRNAEDKSRSVGDKSGTTSTKPGSMSNHCRVFWEKNIIENSADEPGNHSN